MRSPHVRRILARATELTVSLGLVAIAFLFLVGLLGVVFPHGTSLRSLVRTSPTSPVEHPDTAPSIIPTDTGNVATLTILHRKVKSKPADDLAWNDAYTGLGLGDRHSIQTLSRSAARIDFDDATSIQMHEQSLVVIKRRDPFRTSARKPAEVLVLGGSLSGTLSTEPGARELEIITSASRMRLTSDSAASAEFGVSVNPDGSSTYTIQGGSAEIVANGESQTIGPNQAVTASEHGIKAVVTLPGVPRLILREDAFTFRDRAPRVRFDWAPVPGADAYVLEIAPDETFVETIHDTETTETTFTHGNLPRGHYYWRVAARRGIVQGPWSRVGQITLRSDTEPPGLEVAFPDTIVTAPSFRLRGDAERGCRVFVEDVEMTVDRDGSFESEVPLAPGVNVIVVEAIDAAGNSSYRSRFVHAKYQHGK